jgi:hypothetical protein
MYRLVHRFIIPRLGVIPFTKSITQGTLIFILGISGSGLGLRGAALSYLIGTGLPMLVTVVFVVRSTVPAPVRFADGAGQLARALGKLLVPVFASNLAAVLFLAAATRVVAGLGPEAVAAFTMASRVEQLLLLFYTGLVTATMPQLARFLNRGNPDAARVLSQRSAGMMVVFGFGSAVVLFSAGGPLSRALVPAADVQASAYRAAHLVAAMPRLSRSSSSGAQRVSRGQRERSVPARRRGRRRPERGCGFKEASAIEVARNVPTAACLRQAGVVREVWRIVAGFSSADEAQRSFHAPDLESTYWTRGWLESGACSGSNPVHERRNSQPQREASSVSSSGV